MNIRNSNMYIRLAVALGTAAIVFATPLFSAPLLTSVLQPGEELVYKVKYGFVRLGTVVLRTEHDPYSSDPEMMRVSLTMDTEPKIPFLNVHEYSESAVKRSQLTCERFYSELTKSGRRVRERFRYDNGRRIVYWDQTDLESGTMTRNDSVAGVSPFLTGTSLIAFGRAMSTSHTTVSMPIVNEGSQGSVYLDFTKGRAFVEIDALDNHVRTRKYEGQTDSKVSSAGMTGGFTTWVSDDDAAVPIRMEMKIAVGSISLELEKWNRAGWQPPQ
jgi:hypothetical protein